MGGGGHWAGLWSSLSSGVLHCGCGSSSPEVRRHLCGSGHHVVRVRWIALLVCMVVPGRCVWVLGCGVLRAACLRDQHVRILVAQ